MRNVRFRIADWPCACACAKAGARGVNPRDERLRQAIYRGDRWCPSGPLETKTRHVNSITDLNSIAARSAGTHCLRVPRPFSGPRTGTQGWTFWRVIYICSSPEGGKEHGNPGLKHSETTPKGGLFRRRFGSGSAEDGGFEPPRAFTQHAFQACAIGH